MKSTPVL
jgi:hypothetical protein